MPIYTAVSEMIKAALEAIEAIDPGETVSTTDGGTGLRQLNLLLDEYSLDRGKIYLRTEDTKVLTIGQDSYTIGAAGNIVSTIPVLVEQAFIRDTTLTPPYDQPLRVTMEQAEYNAMRFKGQTSRPTALYYELGTALATVYLDFAPDAAYELHLFSHKPFTKLAAVTDALVLPDGYEALLTAALGIRLAPLYHKAVPDVLVRTEQRMSSLIDARNSEPPPNWTDLSQPSTMNWSRGPSAGGRLRGGKGNIYG